MIQQERLFELQTISIGKNVVELLACEVRPWLDRRIQEKVEVTHLVVLNDGLELEVYVFAACCLMLGIHVMHELRLATYHRGLDLVEVHHSLEAEAFQLGERQRGNEDLEVGVVEGLADGSKRLLREVAAVQEDMSWGLPINREGGHDIKWEVSEGHSGVPIIGNIVHLFQNFTKANALLKAILVSL